MAANPYAGHQDDSTGGYDTTNMSYGYTDENEVQVQGTAGGFSNEGTMGYTADTGYTDGNPDHTAAATAGYTDGSERYTADEPADYTADAMTEQTTGGAPEHTADVSNADYSADAQQEPYDASDRQDSQNAATSAITEAEFFQTNEEYFQQLETQASEVQDPVLTKRCESLRLSCQSGNIALFFAPFASVLIRFSRYYQDHAAYLLQLMYTANEVAKNKSQGQSTASGGTSGGDIPGKNRSSCQPNHDSIC